MNQCAYLKEWLIASCSAGDVPFVVIPFMLKEYCRSGKAPSCPLKDKAGEPVLYRVAVP
jgi:hypothetical protein